ncbi:hypothetical protein BYT27DRAFT_7181793 [Phlegmacium glaucopus]|nr:hypothetical protein BYT27DRAFT_7181793 [Phlegmacium glaucopus]
MLLLPPLPPPRQVAADEGLFWVRGRFELTKILRKIQNPESDIDSSMSYTQWMLSVSSSTLTAISERKASIMQVLPTPIIMIPNPSFPPATTVTIRHVIVPSSTTTTRCFRRPFLLTRNSGLPSTAAT